MTHDYKRKGTATLFAALNTWMALSSACVTIGTAIKNGSNS
jgi:hypothetical protein